MTGALHLPTLVLKHISKINREPKLNKAKVMNVSHFTSLLEMYFKFIGGGILFYFWFKARLRCVCGGDVRGPGLEMA